MGAGRRLPQIEAYELMDLPPCRRQRHLSAVRENMTTTRTRLRHLVPAFVAIPLLAGLLVGANMAVASPVNANSVASDYKFQGMPVAMPPGYDPTGTIRPVTGAYQHLVSWISSVGASIAMTDVTGHAQADGMCIVDTRTNDVIITYAPMAPGADRFRRFALTPPPRPS